MHGIGQSGEGMGLDEQLYPSFLENPTHRIRHLFPFREPRLRARLGSARPGVREEAESDRIPHTHLVLTTITTLGVGPLTSRCTMPNRWRYIFESPWDGGGVRRGSPTAATRGTSFRDPEV